MKRNVELQGNLLSEILEKGPLMCQFVLCNIMKEEFEDTKKVIRTRISKKIIQHTGQKKKYKRTNIDLQNIHIKLKIE